MLWASTKAFDAIAIASTTIIIIMVIIISAQALCQCTSAYTCEVHIHLDVWVPMAPICSTFGYGCEDPYKHLQKHLMLSSLTQRPSLLLWSSSSLRKPYVSARVLTLVKFTSTWIFGCLRCPYVPPSGTGVRIQKSIQKSIWCYRHWLEDRHYYYGHHHICPSLMSVHECLYLWSSHPLGCLGA